MKTTLLQPTTTLRSEIKKNKFLYLWSLIFASELYAESKFVGSYGAPVVVPESKAISTAFCGNPQEFPENNTSAPSTTYPRVSNTILNIALPVEDGLKYAGCRKE